MLTKALLFTVIAACGVSSSTPATAEPPPSEQPGDFAPPPEPPPKDSHWCCQSVDPKTKSGDGCTGISGSLELINACAEYLNCSGGAVKSNGKVTCT
jgi:hypothetical protein